MEAPKGTDILKAGSDLLKVLHLDDDHPGTRDYIHRLLNALIEIAISHPDAAMVLLRESANHMLEAPALATLEEIEGALMGVGGTKAFEATG